MLYVITFYISGGEQPPPGGHLDEMIKLFPAGKPLNLFDHCDWLDSPARPQYLYQKRALEYSKVFKICFRVQLTVENLFRVQLTV